MSSSKGAQERAYNSINESKHLEGIYFEVGAMPCRGLLVAKSPGTSKIVLKLRFLPQHARNSYVTRFLDAIASVQMDLSGS